MLLKCFSIFLSVAELSSDVQMRRISIWWDYAPTRQSWSFKLSWLCTEPLWSAQCLEVYISRNPRSQLWFSGVTLFEFKLSIVTITYIIYITSEFKLSCCQEPKLWYFNSIFFCKDVCEILLATAPNVVRLYI